MKQEPYLTVTLDEGDSNIEIRTSSISLLSREELSNLSKVLWDFSWEIDVCEFIATNEKTTQYWVYSFPYSTKVDYLKELRWKLLPIIRESISGKSISFVGWWD